MKQETLNFQVQHSSPWAFNFDYFLLSNPKIHEVNKCFITAPAR